MAGLSRLNKLGLDRAQFTPEQWRAFERRDSEWTTFALSDNDNSDAHLRHVIQDLKQTTRPPPENAPRPAGRVVANYTDGRCLIELDEAVMEADRRLYDPEPKYRDEFRPYGATDGVAAGSKIRGPELAAMVDPTGQKYGDATKHPGYSDRQGQRDRAAGLVRRKGPSMPGVADYMPAAELDNRGSNLKLTSKPPPPGSYGNPDSYPSRDGWRSKFNGGYSQGRSGRTYRE